MINFQKVAVSQFSTKLGHDFQTSAGRDQLNQSQILRFEKRSKNQ